MAQYNCKMALCCDANVSQFELDGNQCSRG